MPRIGRPSLGIGCLTHKAFSLAKKKFTEGLESLFAEVEEPAFDKQGKKASDSGKPSSKDGKGGRYGADLESFLSDAFEDAFEEKLGQGSKDKRKKKSRKSLSGLDILIRNTVDPQQQIEIEDLTPKRITLTLDDEHLAQLREMARQRKTYLKEMIKEIVADYLKNRSK